MTDSRMWTTLLRSWASGFETLAGARSSTTEDRDGQRNPNPTTATTTVELSDRKPNEGGGEHKPHPPRTSTTPIDKGPAIEELAERWAGVGAPREQPRTLAG